MNILIRFAIATCKFVKLCHLRVLCMLCGSISIDIYYNLSPVWAPLMLNAFGRSHSCNGHNDVLLVLPSPGSNVHFMIYSELNTCFGYIKNIDSKFVCVK